MKSNTQTAPILEDSPFEVIGTAPLTPKDACYLQEREEIIKRGRTTFLEVGRALLEIRNYRDEILYRDKYGTFEQYCRERWEFGRTYAYR